jgi:uncharacterized protein involved in copper resistance
MDHPVMDHLVMDHLVMDQIVMDHLVTTYRSNRTAGRQHTTQESHS